MTNFLLGPRRSTVSSLNAVSDLAALDGTGGDLAAGSAVAMVADVSALGVRADGHLMAAVADRAPLDPIPGPIPPGARDLIAATTRRTMDIIVSVLALILLLPVHIVVILAIRLDSTGPVIFRQERLGRGRRPFVLLKYRTMTPTADAALHRMYVQALIVAPPTEAADPAPQSEVSGTLYKLTIDPRVTTVGRRLRQWSIDEIPQLINVLRGDMALVGPRPVIPYEAELYPPTYLARFRVKPGMTGLWQVSGRNRCTYDEMVQLDVHYAMHRSLWLDLKILIKTVPVVFGREGVA